MAACPAWKRTEEKRRKEKECFTLQFVVSNEVHSSMQYSHQNGLAAGAFTPDLH